MGCCIAIALLIGVVRTTWFKLVPSRAPVEQAFAPVARRPAPGSTGASDRERSPAPAPVAPAPPVRSRGSSWTQGLAVLGVALAAYAATMALATSAGLLASSRPVGLWLVLAVALLAAGAFAAGAGGATVGGLPRGTGLIIAGAAWLAISELDAHVLQLVGHSVLLHAPGPIAITIGLALRGGLTPQRLVSRPFPTLRPGATQ